MWSCRFIHQFHDTLSSPRFMKLIQTLLLFVDVKDQTEYFMEKGEIRKYIPFLKLYSSVSAFLYSSRSSIWKHISHDYHTQTSLLISFCKADVITCLKHSNSCSPHLSLNITQTECNGLFNLKHSNVFLTNCAELCHSTRRTWTECCLYMQNIHVSFFFCISTLYTRRNWPKRKEEVSTNTMHYDKSGKHILCSICTTHPWDLDAEW